MTDRETLPEGPHMAKLIRIVREGSAGVHVEIDGEVFPWLILNDPMTVDVTRESVPSVRLTLMADRIEVVDDLTNIAP